ncbi:MAG TPA: hemerythrin domain-containing protein [Candidatus Limnocylindrales bacterium]|nr:hemerythrin domain-containing protein [Candidatus Limnocylindrales bacterium]
MDALNLLEQDHTELRRLLRELEAAVDAEHDRGVRFRALHEALTRHEQLEEELFYPALRDHPKAKEMVLESYVEHDVVDRLLSDMVELDVRSELWPAKMAVLKENLEHHIEEEETELWKKARQALGEEERAELGERMAARRDQLRQHAAAAGAPASD